MAKEPTLTDYALLCNYLSNLCNTVLTKQLSTKQNY